MKKIKFISIPEAAQILGLDRTHVFRLIKSGVIPAQKIGRNWAIDSRDLGVFTDETTPQDKKLINETVHKVFREYGDVIKKLGAE
jgi:excisionase family DNA binding protein